MDNLRRFLVVFTAMFFVAAAICGFLLVQSFDDAQGERTEHLHVDAPTYDPNADLSGTGGFRENILCMVGDSGKNTPDLMFLLNVDSVSGNVSFLFIPQNMKYAIAQSNDVGAFGEYFGRYAWNNTNKATTLLSSFLDIDVEYYFTLSTENFSKLIATFSSEDQGVLMDIPVDMEYKKDGLNISFSKGKQYLNGDDVVKYIQFGQTEDGVYSAEMLPYYDGTDTKQIGQLQVLFDAILRQKFTEASTQVYKNNFSALFFPYLGKGNTNLTGEHLDAIAQVVRGLKTNNLNYFVLNGKTVYNGKTYLEYNNTMRNFLLEESVSTVKGADVLNANFGTGA